MVLSSDLNIQKILREHDLRKTACRMSMLKLFLENKHALSPTGIESMLDNFFDRVTIYRTLATFEELGILHKVPSGSGMVNYAICKGGCSHTQHSDKHTHFQCLKCEKTFCLDEIKDLNLKLPDGYIAQDWRLLFTGICQNCNQ
jgi:Fur family ferric uptake transcriptional regulator